MSKINGDLISINDNGAWCWFQDERALIDPETNTLLVGSVAAPEGPDGASRAGNVELAILDLSSGECKIIALHEQLEADDHNAPALLIRPDGHYVAMYAKHKSDDLSRWRVSTRPHDATGWEEEEVFDWNELTEGRGATYSNLHYLSAEDRVYNFVRAINDDPSIMISDDHGDSWSYGGKLLTEPKVGYVNGYTRYADNGVDRIDLITTEHHPRDFNNSIYHGYLSGGRLHAADGSVVDDNVLDDDGRSQTLLTTIFTAGTEVDGEVLTHGWTCDLRRGATGSEQEGQLAAIISCRANDVPENSNFDDHRFFYARFDGRTWTTRHLAQAGPALWADEQDYTGLGCVDPYDLDTIYVSTPIDPRDGTDLEHHEIFSGRTDDEGATWQWSPITEESTVDNFRPIVAPGDPSRSALLWFRGTMSRSQHYRAEVVGIVADRTTH